MMPRHQTAITILAVTAFFAMPAAWAMEIEGRVTKVIDGDTIWVKSDGRHHNVKMQYIVAPELTQAHGAKARSNLRTLINGKTVRVRWSEYDRHGRAIGQVFYRDEDVNLRQIRDGYARHDKEYAERRQDRHDFYFYGRAEEEANMAQHGLWKGKENAPQPRAAHDPVMDSVHREIKGERI